MDGTFTTITYFLATFDELIYSNNSIFIFVHFLFRKKRIKHFTQISPRYSQTFTKWAEVDKQQQK